VIGQKSYHNKKYRYNNDNKSSTYIHIVNILHTMVKYLVLHPVMQQLKRYISIWSTLNILPYYMYVQDALLKYL
jgi:hypothetical protein